MSLDEFLALEAPFLTGVPPDRLLGEIDRLRAAAAGKSRLYPDAPGEQLDLLRDVVESFFRREEIRRSLTADERRSLFRTLALTRATDDLLKRLYEEKPAVWEGHASPMKGFRAFGQEAAAGLALRLRRDGERGDLACPLIRGLPITLAFTDDPVAVVLSQTGKQGTIFNGRDLHIGDLSRGVLPPAAPLAIGMQTLVGMALAARMRREDRVFLAVMGEGGTSMGEWHEAINFAAARRLALVFVVENNQWALGTTWREQSAAPRFALRAAGYGMPGITVDGNDADEVAVAGAWAAERARAGKGPALLELVTYRRAGHAHHDDDRYRGGGGLKGYELEDDRRRWEADDPVARYEAKLRAEGVLDDVRVAAIRAEIEAKVAAAGRAALEAPWPGPEDVDERLYSPRVDPVPATRPLAGRAMSIDEAVRQALVEAMERDPRVFVLGEDVGGRYGGAFGVTRGLAKQFGADRCLNTPIAESAILGAAVGAALAGLRPVAEMQFADFVACGFNGLVNNAAKLRWRWGRGVPMVVRLPYGGASASGKLLGGGPYHSQCPEAWFFRVPGLKIVAPSTPADAKGLLTAAIRDGNPVLYLEPKGLYGMFSPSVREEVPLGDFEVEIGKGIVRRAGRDLSILAYGTMTHAALGAAETLARDGIQAEVVDLRTLVPMDEDLLLSSVAKTHRALIVHEDSKRGGVGAEIAALLAERALYDLDAPVVRVAAPDFPVPYSPPLEKAFLPGADDIVRGANRLMDGKP